MFNSKFADIWVGLLLAAIGMLMLYLASGCVHQQPSNSPEVADMDLGDVCWSKCQTQKLAAAQKRHANDSTKVLPAEAPFGSLGFKGDPEPTVHINREYLRYQREKFKQTVNEATEWLQNKNP